VRLVPGLPGGYIESRLPGFHERQKTDRHMNTIAPTRSARRVPSSLFLLALLVLFMAGCGGGGGDSPPPVPSRTVWIVSPTSSNTYETDRDTVVLSGGAFVPEGAYCPWIVGVMPPGYSVTWTNSATGSSGGASFYLGCLLQVNVIWETYPIALAMGANTITVTATDAEGNSASSSLVVTRVPDVTAPLVVSVSPPAGASDVAVNASVLVTFNEEMDPASIDASTITLHDELGNPVPASVAYLAYSQSARLTPASPLAYSTTYDVTVTQDVRDVAGNSLAVPYAFSFTTRANPDTTPPSVQSVNPPDGSYCASPSGAVSATFDEDIDPLTIDATSFTLTGPGSQAVAGTVSYLDRIATFIPDAALPLSTPFTATLMTGIKDLAGNPLAAPYPWSFTTAGTQAGSWAPTSLNGAPSARSNHVAVWTGSEMIVSGGFGFDYTSQFGRYDPSTGTWTVSTGAPVGIYQKAVWADSRMLVWGGYIYGSAVTGGAAYVPGANSWTLLSTAGQPSARYDHTAVWTGSEMIVWGGRNSLGSTFGNGFRYDPLSDTWTPMSNPGHLDGFQYFLAGAVGVIVEVGQRHHPAMQDR
jgi:hypothetical protein